MVKLNSIGANIKRLRQEHNYTQADLARCLNVSQQTIQRYESGEIKNIPLSHIEKIAVIFNVLPQSITGWTDSTDNNSELKQVARRIEKEFSPDDADQINAALDLLLNMKNKQK